MATVIAEDPAVLDADQAAAKFGVSPVTMRRWAREGRIAAELTALGWRFRADEVEWLLDPLSPGDPIPPERTGGMAGFVVAECGHRVSGSEWAAGFRTCERCPAGGSE